MTAAAGWLEEWLALESPARMSRVGELRPEELCEIHTEVLRCLYQDRPRAEALATLAQEIAELRKDVMSRSWADRIAGHLRHVGGDYAGAVDAYNRAAAGFSESGAAIEVGRTLLSGLQALIYTGDYARAEQWAARAEAIFSEAGDTLRLARLDSNVGNILYRQDRHREAIVRYQRALDGFQLCGEPRDTATALSNLATCSITLAEFPAALDYYQRARDHCERHQLADLVARADYNVAYMHYLRGDYRNAFELYQRSRELCRQTGDAYHEALCDLDEAEMSLELNLAEDGQALARRALAAFAGQGLKYEQAKCHVNIAVSASQRGDHHGAGMALLQARRLFGSEGNVLWVALVDQLRAVVAFRQGNFGRARRLGAAAWRELASSTMPGRAAYCQILLARLWLQRGEIDRALKITRQAVEQVGDHVSPSLRFHANLVQGAVHEARGRWRDAAASYESARLEIENMRERLESEDLRISLLADKLAVYEALASLCLESPAAGELGGSTRAFSLVQEAKSRNLADRLLESSLGQPGETDNARQLRRELNCTYRQLELALLLDVLAHGGRAESMRSRARELERRLVDERKQSSLAAAPSPARDADLRLIRHSLRPDEKLIEYYEIRGRVHAFLLDAHGLEAVPLGPVDAVIRALKFAQFQMGKFRWADREEMRQPRNLKPAVAHFHELYEMLIAPLAERLNKFRHLVIAPHRILHKLPFAALHDGEHALIDRFSLSVAPSAAVFARSRARERWPTEGALVMAVPDPHAPGIEQEAHLVEAMVPGSRLVLGEDASVDEFRRSAPGRRLLHLASHGVHRGDNPLFSALRLSDARLSLYDLQNLRLNIDVVTLSACNTGSTVTVAGDELIGLMRGFLLAGVRSLAVALWEIDDVSTREFMRSFYRQATGGETVASAMRTAIREARSRHPHPYFWAPFLLVGDPDSRIAP